MTDHRVIAEVRDYAQLMDAFRGWITELGTTLETVDHVAGLPLRYSGKLFAPVPIKAIGRTSLGPLLGATGLKLLVCVDTEVLERIKHRLVPRKKARARTSGAIRAKKSRTKSQFVGSSDWGRVMKARQMLVTTAEQRSEQARKAIMVRWAKQRRDARNGPTA